MGQKRVGVSRTPRYLKVETRSMGDPAKNEGTKLGSWEGLWENNMYFMQYLHLEGDIRGGVAPSQEVFKIR